MAKSNTKKGKQKAPAPPAAPPPPPLLTQAPVQFTRMIQEEDDYEGQQHLSTIREDDTPWGAQGGGGEAWPMTDAPAHWALPEAPENTNPAHAAWGIASPKLGTQWPSAAGGSSPQIPGAYFAAAPNSPEEEPLQLPPGSEPWTAWGHEAGMKGAPTPAPVRQTASAATTRRMTTAPAQTQVPSWQTWGAEATGRAYRSPAAAVAAYPPSQPRVAFANGPTLIPHRSDMSDHDRRALLNSVLEQQPPPPVPVPPPQRKLSRKSKKVTTTTQYDNTGWGTQAQVQDDPWTTQDQSDWGHQGGGAWDQGAWAEPQQGRPRGNEKSGRGKQENRGGWGAPDQGGGWGTPNQGGEWGTQSSQGGWGQQEDRGGWGGQDSRNERGASNNDPWGTTGHDERGRGDDGWGRGDDGWGKGDDGWGKGDDEEDESDEWERIDDGWSSGVGGEQRSELLGDSRRPRRANHQSVTQSSRPATTMPSRTMAYAVNNSPSVLASVDPVAAQVEKRERKESGSQRIPLGPDVPALKPVARALFGRQRKAKDRIKWWFPPDKDPNVRSLIEWIKDPPIAADLGAHGLELFLRTRERGALFMNALYNPPPDVPVPAIEWLSWEQVVETRDRMLQEFVGYYDPAEYTLVFVLLPSPSGNSVAIWREKVRVPPEARIGRTPDVDLAKAALRKEYPVTVDEWPSPVRTTRTISAEGPPPPKKKKKGFFRRLFRPLFRVEW